ncbi:MAG: sensor histidine kinase [Solirubrobacteraceae bacterium]
MSFAVAPVATPQRARAFTVAVSAVAIAAAAVGAVALANGAARTDTTTLAAVTQIGGLSFVGSGLVAWRRRPEVWTGPLMVGGGFAIFAGSLANYAGAAMPFTIGLVLTPLPAAVICQLILAFPEGRLHSWFERLVVAGAYFTALVAQVVMLMFMGPENLAGCPCPTNLVFIRDEPGLHQALMSAQRFLALLVGGAAAWIVIRRWQWASRPLRRAFAPIILTGGLAIALALVTLVAAQTNTTAWAGFTAAANIAAAAIPIAYLLGLFRARLGRVAVSDLIVELGRTPAPGKLRDALARALRDPSLELAYWVPESQTYVGIDGQRVEPVTTPERTVTVLERHGERIAALMHDPALAEDPALLNSVSTAAGLALENERLLADLRAQLEELRESRARIVEAGDTERRRLERNLHDGAQQRLVSLALALALAESNVEQEPSTAVELLQAARSELTTALAELRELARGIHPALLTERGLGYAVSALAQRAPFHVGLELELEQRPAPPIEAAAYYVVAEALTNVAKYAHATTATVSVNRKDGLLRVQIADDGVGGAEASAGSGLRGLDDRVQAVGGTLRVNSPAGKGTRIIAELPAD